ncbi:MAG: type II toxin-antitoxin system PemK/MazF family toxin [Actinomycetales bacterium]
MRWGEFVRQVRDAGVATARQVQSARAVRARGIVDSASTGSPGSGSRPSPDGAPPRREPAAVRGRVGAVARRTRRSVAGGARTAVARVTTRRSRSRPITPPNDGRPLAYPGDFTGAVELRYAPRPDSHADPGEVVWAWVPFEEDHQRGKDRPALVIAKESQWLLALMLTSRDHDLDSPAQTRSGRSWFDIGTGDWDPQRRPSEVRTDRIIRLDPVRVRRQGGRVSLRVFDAVAAEVRRVNGW